MKDIRIWALALLIAGFTSTVCLAEWSFSNTGGWPKSWPAELEPLRPQSRTLVNEVGTMYHIPFSERGDFEAAWPHLLTVATHGAPLTLSRGHDAVNAVDFNAGVVIFTPNIGEDGIDAVRADNGALAEYVVPNGPSWRPITAKEMREDRRTGRRARRVRTEIRLVVDGKVVDLNRIPIPALVIDERFSKD